MEFIGAGIFCAIITGYIAKDDGRNVVLAVVLGFFFTFFAIIGYLIAGKTHQKKLDDHVRMQAEIDTINNVQRESDKRSK